MPNNAPNGKAPLDILTNLEPLAAPVVEEKKPLEISKAISNDGISVDPEASDKEEQEPSESKFIDERLN